DYRVENQYMNHQFPNPEVRNEYLEPCRGFAATLPRYLDCSAPVQAVVRDLALLFNNPDIDGEERQLILRALAVTLYKFQDDRPPEPQEPSPARPAVPEEGFWHAQ